MNYKYWKVMLVFIVSLGVSLMVLLKGKKYFDTKYPPVIFSIFFTGTIISGIWLKAEKDSKRGTKEELRNQEKWAGKLETKNQELVFTYDKEPQTKIKISEIKVIGEFTTNADPTIIDWYLIIVKRNNEIVYLPAYAVGIQEILKQLSRKFNHEIVPKLYASIQFDSNVIYPKSIDGKKLFHLKGLNPKGVFGKKKTTIGFSSIVPILRKEIIELKD